MLGQRINEQRKARGWNQIDLAKKLNITKQTVSNWENDNILPSIEMLVKISNAFGVSTDYLLGLDNLPRIDVSGLTTEEIAHISLIINDLKNKP